MPPLPSSPPPEEDGLLLKNVRFYSAEGNQLQLFGQFPEVRFCAEQRLLKSEYADILWLPEQFTFQAQRLNARLDTQEAWASSGWKFQTEDNGFGKGSSAYAYKDSQGSLFAQTQEPLHLWQRGNMLNAQEAYCDLTTKTCEFFDEVKTTLNKAP